MGLGKACALVQKRVHWYKSVCIDTKACALVQKRVQRQFWTDLNVYFLKNIFKRKKSFWKIIFSSTQKIPNWPPFLIIFIKTFVICTFNEPILFFLHVLYNVISLNINNSNTPKNKRKFTHSPSSNTMGKPLRREVILSKNLILPTTTFFQYGNTSKKKQAFSVWDFQKFRLTWDGHLPPGNYREWFVLMQFCT